MRIYLAAHYALKAHVNEFKAKLEEQGHTVVGRWLGDLHSVEEIFRNSVECGTVIQSDDEISEQLATDCLEDVDNSNAIILFFNNNPDAQVPSFGGKWVEFGFAAARGKQLHIIGENLSGVFCYLPQVVRHLDEEACLYAFDQVRHRTKGG